MKIVQFYYPLVYGDMSSYEIEKLKKKLCDMVEEYEKKSKQSQKVKNSQSSSLRPPLPKRGSYADKFKMFMDSNTSTEHKLSHMRRKWPLENEKARNELENGESSGSANVLVIPKAWQCYVFCT
ncbi:hypothetical protein ZIOFF_051156 [Zingiber officinale]|uniref:Uncharacterized protein n=1 Tax=Zingiber officinale TaxID=94328 RepID=A0A8J5FS48_ZINOF|nr:hypothetical protein ZIOFF_051156 [Zingiber officinale]